MLRARAYPFASWCSAGLVALLFVSCFTLGDAALKQVVKPKEPFPGVANLVKDFKPHLPWAHKVFDAVRETVQRAAHSFLHEGGTQPLRFPLEIDVCLMGFEADGGFGYELSAIALQKFLQDTFFSYRPSCLETGKELEMSIELQYSVQHIPPSHLSNYEKKMKKTFTRVYPTNAHDSVRSYQLEATELEPLLMQIYNSTFDTSKKQDIHDPYVLFFVNPDKRRIDPSDKASQETPALEAKNLLAADINAIDDAFSYRYMYNGVGNSGAWLSGHRFALVDLSAGPSIFGRVGVPEGTVGPRAVPRLAPILAASCHQGNASSADETARQSHDDAKAMHAEQMKDAQHVRARDMYVIGSMSTTVMSAVQHLFAPDVRAENLDFAQRVLMPVIVLRNHHDFNPLNPGHAHSIDLDLLEHQARNMIHFNQELVMVAGTHNLHEHERLALAVTRAMTAHSSAVAGAQGKYKLKARPVLDSKVLLEEMRHAADLLASGLIGLHDPAAAKSFYNSDVPGDESPKNPKGSPTGPRRSFGTHVVPVYVMSLAGMPEGLLLDGDSLVAASDDIVLVLQTVSHRAKSPDEIEEGIPLRFTSEGEDVHVLPQDPTRHMVAGVGMALAGLASPMESHSQLHGKYKEDFMWAVGHHPFGPMSNTSTMSLLLQDTARRNSIFSQVDSAVADMRAGLSLADDFADQYLQRPFGDRIHESVHSEDSWWLDRVYHDPQRSRSGRNLLPHKIISRIQKDLAEMESQFVTLGSYIFYHRLEEAHLLSSNVLAAAHSFKEYVEQTLSFSREDMRCCKLEHKVPPRSRVYKYAAILASGVGIYWAVIYLAQPNPRSAYHSYGRH
ncbi:hypothetical protein CYMTET_53494 [Cymbomonas tetramitiformis]|uniref:DUF7906 domain-containing protein n=1 Tax=Cymbomonas tetramitiformis TaxID=36881 RepID=A0AAE0BIA8_9CHLO|nr:hypothetical protein CYMTET_53494 [Cymbomonas tetramitiformis]